MFVISQEQVQYRIAELQADAAKARLAREAHPAHEGHNPVREFVGSVVTSVRVALEPALPMLNVPAYRS